jgi:uncharacterized protein (TIGR02147 family)
MQLTTDYRVLLREELLQRMNSRPSYSSNAMARDLGLSKAFLSQIINGKRKLSAKSALSITRRLSWTPRKQKLFIDLVRYDVLKTNDGKELLWRDIERQLGRAKCFSDLDVEQFKLISNWYHFAILELCELKSFQGEPAWISHQLGISELQARDAVERLVHLGLLRREGAKLSKTRDNSIRSVPSEAIRRFHEEHLGKAAKALRTAHFSEREFSGVTVCTSPRQLEKARKMIQEFRRELMAVLESGPRTRVYHLAVQLYPLSKEG